MGSIYITLMDDDTELNVPGTGRDLSKLSEIRKNLAK